MEVTKSYDWEGNLSGYQWDNMSVPLAEGNRHYHEIKNAITNGTCIVNEPAIKEVTAAYNQKGNLSGYRWNHIFVSIPIDESKPFHRMVKRAIEDGSCVIKEPDPIKTEGPLLETIIFCVFFDQPWPLEGPYQGIIPYQSHAEAESRAYTFRLINLSSVGKLNGLDLLFDYHSGALPEQFLIHYPLQSSVLELEVPVSYLQKLFFNERSQLEEHENNFINMIVIPHLRESGRKRPTTKFLISLSVYYLRNFIMDVGNRIIEAVSREHGSVPIGYIDKWKLWKEIFILHKDVHGTYRLGGFGWQGNQSLDLRENWLAWSGLRQMSEPEKNPTPLYTHTLQKCRMLLKGGLHIEALCLLDALLEVDIRDTLCACMRNDTEAQKIINKMYHSQRLKILKKIVKLSKDDIIRNDDHYFSKIKKVREIHERRNAYVHALNLVTKDQEQDHYLEKAHYLTVRQRQSIEELMHGFIDAHESMLWYLMQNRLATNQDEAVVQFIQEAVRRRKIEDQEKTQEHYQSLFIHLSDQFFELDKQSFTKEEVKIILDKALNDILQFINLGDDS